MLYYVLKTGEDKMKIRLLVIIGIILVVMPIGFYYYISINGFSTHHAGISVSLLSEEQLEGFGTDDSFPVVSKDELSQFPQIYTMVNLLLEEKNNPQETRSFFVSFDTYRIFTSHDEFEIQNYMSDSGAISLYDDFIQDFDSGIFIYDGNYFSIGSWIA